LLGGVVLYQRLHFLYARRHTGRVFGIDALGTYDYVVDFKSKNLGETAERVRETRTKLAENIQSTVSRIAVAC